MRRMRRWASAVAVSSLVLVSAACTDSAQQPSELSDESSTSAAPSSGPASGSTAPTTDYTPEEQAVIDQYKGYYNAIYTLSNPTDEQVHAAFTPYAEQPVVENWVSVFQQFAAEDRTPGGGIEFGPLQVSAAEGSATVVECRDGTSETMIQISSGAVVATGEPGTRIETGLAPDASGTWLVQWSEPQVKAC